MAKIQIYTKGYCPFCKIAKTTLKRLGQTFEEFDITHDVNLQKEMMERSQRRTVPQIFIGDHHIGGNDDLQHARRTGYLNDVLNAQAN